MKTNNKKSQQSNQKTQQESMLNTTNVMDAAAYEESEQINQSTQNKGK